MEKTSLKLTTIIGIYLLIIAALLAVVTAAFVISFNKVGGGRADDTERQVMEWIAVAEETDSLDIASFPEKGDYVVEENGAVTDSGIKNCKEQDMNRGMEILKSSGMERYLEGQDVFLLKKIQGKTIYIHYSLKVQGEWLVLAGFIGAYILAILIPSVILIHGLRKMIYEIAQEKWRKEYETKQEMAQIAHDLKTPLTVIRGNADLLLEKDQDEDSLESINAIISSSERIARSVLDILEK